ncbi:tetratricopeptide repeat protein [Pyxidicoccus xibeiensis]|uniref:tetratricopeptide repeat protein n=1 Tax=Pyxidicoccus xibeiensis TaxID=2906759 RepID=UPI0020A7D72A|nr:tetratricopeptide repeat protein [Pyxidicoccus xibeiensis]MCP3139296.1 tetratricopeptide repeat protein [Pyxidicoccus xibeiensis]
MHLRSLRPLLLLATLVVGCSPALKVRVLEPAKVNVGSAKQLALVQTEGRRSARDYVVRELKRQSRNDGYFALVDRTDEGTIVKVAGRTVEVHGDKATPLAPGEIGLRVDVLDWNTDMETRVTETKDDKGNVHKRKQDVYVGKVALGVTAYNAAGKVLLAEDEYVYKQEGDKADGLLTLAASNAVYRLLHDLTPRQVTHSLRMDDDDEAQKGIIEVAEKGNLEGAITQLKAYAEQHPENGGAWYNLAVLQDASGEYEQALEHYSRAISLASKDFYVKMKQQCEGRLASRLALME